MRRAPTKRAPRLRSDAPIPSEMFVALPPFLDVLVFAFARIVSALDEVFNTKAPLLGRALVYVVARVQYRASLYLRGIRWFDVDRLIFGGTAVLTDLVLWELFQPATSLVVTVVWIAAVPWRDAPLASVFTRHHIVKTRIQLIIDTTGAILVWPFSMKLSKLATKLYQGMHPDSHRAQTPRNARYAQSDVDSFTKCKSKLDNKTCLVLVNTTEDAGEETRYFRVAGILNAHEIIHELIDLSIHRNFVDYYHYVGISGERKFPQVFIVGPRESDIRYVSMDELKTLVARNNVQFPELDQLGVPIETMTTVFADVPKRVDGHA